MSTKEISIPGLTLTKTNDILSQERILLKSYDFSNSEFFFKLEINHNLFSSDKSYYVYSNL
jgi:hypothetical protein